MSEKLATGETLRDRQADCAAMGSRAVADCITCPAAVSCPILQLKKRSEDLNAESPVPKIESTLNSGDYGETSFATQRKDQKPTNPSQLSQDALKRKIDTANKPPKPVQKPVLKPIPKPPEDINKKNYIDLLLDDAVRMVVAPSLATVKPAKSYSRDDFTLAA